MADTSKEKQKAESVYEALQAASCPLLEGLYLQGSDSMLQLLCTPSQLRTDILTWICSSIKPNFANLKEKSSKLEAPDILTKEMAALGLELMLCKEDDLELIRGDASPRQQLQFLQQLLTLLPGDKKSAEHCMGVEMLLNTSYAAENLPNIRQLLTPTFDPWPANIRALHRSFKSPCRTLTRKETADVAVLLQSTRSVLEQLKSECEFLKTEGPDPGDFSPSVLHVAGCDLQQLMATFCHVYETDFSTFSKRDPPSFSTEPEVFKRVYELLQACNTELEVLHEVSEASASVTEEVSRLPAQPHWTRGEKHTLSDQLEELNRRYTDFVSRLHT